MIPRGSTSPKAVTSLPVNETGALQGAKVVARKAIHKQTRTVATGNRKARDETHSTIHAIRNAEQQKKGIRKENMENKEQQIKAGKHVKV